MVGAYLYVDNSSIPIPTNYSKYELPILYLREGDKDTPRPLYIAVALFIRRVLDVDTKGQVLCNGESRITGSWYKFEMSS